VRFLLQKGEVLAYGWHWDLEGWLAEKLRAVVLEGERFSLPPFPYRDRVVYEALLEIPRGETLTYGELAKRAGLPYPQVLAALLKNPFQVLVPCHRLVTKKGTLMGFYPLGVAVKRRLLELEGVRLEE